VRRACCRSSRDRVAELRSPDAWSTLAGMRRLAHVHRLSALLFALAVLALVASAGSVPHAHQSPVPAFFNEDHELSAFAALGTGLGVVEHVLAAAPHLLVVPLSAVLARSAPLAPPARSSDFRAPPVC